MQNIPYSETDIKRLGWHCRRGMLELDVILGPFLEKHFRQLPFSDQQCFEKLVACEDQDIFAWVMKHAEPDDENLKRIVDVVLGHVSP